VWIAIGIVAIVILAIAAVVVTARQRSTTGTLSRETRRRDEAASGSAVSTSVAPEGEESPGELTEEGRARAAEARRAIESGSSTVPEPAAPATPAVYEPVDLEEIGISRRQFFNRSILAGTGLGLGAFGVASLAFLWPSASGGFGGKVVVGSESDAKAAFDNKIPYYNAGAKTYIVPYPKGDIPKAKKVPAYTGANGPSIIPGMEAGYVALYQRCVHLGCRVPWCQSSQWFECPCHGSKYNRVGEKRGGPAPHGLDRFVLTVSGGNITVDTGTIVIGPPIGTDTTGQSPEGAPCV
jgi:cytochrome b6-f complex iron-sulfur subunit